MISRTWERFRWFLCPEYLSSLGLNCYLLRVSIRRNKVDKKWAYIYLVCLSNTLGLKEFSVKIFSFNCCDKKLINDIFSQLERLEDWKMNANLSTGIITLILPVFALYLNYFFKYFKHLLNWLWFWRLVQTSVEIFKIGAKFKNGCSEMAKSWQ